MSEIPQPIPLEEQLKQDPRFSYGIKLAPELTGCIVSLFSHKQEQPESKHSRFWLAYLEREFAWAKNYQDGLESIGESAREHRLIEEGRFIFDVMPAIVATDDSYFEDPITDDDMLIVTAPFSEGLGTGTYLRDLPAMILEDVRVI